ncbi:hypothetical protein AX16_008653 [Volvariella volvacea WC 439]|nr:hypothetical protein AX16_008653 [Volvariella volvacea WC 439]
MSDSSAARSGLNKRKARSPNVSAGRTQSKRRRTSAQSKVVTRTGASSAPWPPHFHELYKVFKATNTFLAFSSLRKQLGISFNSVRSSIERLLNHPLDLAHIAQIKCASRALLPNLIRFAYVSTIDLRAQEGRKQPEPGHRDKSPDYAAFSRDKAAAQGNSPEGSELYVLVLEFTDDPRTKKPASPGLTFQAPTSLSSGALKKLVENRNQRFESAVNDLIAAAQDLDPVALLVEAAREHVPIDPTARPTEIVTASANIPTPAERPSIEDILTEIRHQDWFQDQICERRTFEAREGCIDVIGPPLSPAISQALLSARGISGLYTHQAAAIRSIASGRHVVVSTSTASGKSVIYQVPTLSFLEATPDATAIFIYPTKALAQDQRAGMEQLIANCPTLQHIQIANYDGDTPQELRKEIREASSVIFTNFDMIHASILPHEDVWRQFLKNLKLLVVDELHYYSGLLGSHVAYILRRLRRICAAVGNRRVQFASCSATISDPLVHVQRLFGVPPATIDAITEDGAPSSHKEFLVWNTALEDPEGTSKRRHSSMSEAINLMEFLMTRGVRVILFCKTRKACELATKALRTRLSNNGRHDILKKVQPYRGGYSQQDRRRIEREAFNGDLLGIIATNALELGVDIGVLDAVIMLGFPLNKASFWQQAGRAGRRSRDSLVVFVAEMYPVDQYYIQNPQELFENSPDELVVDLDSKLVLEAHLQCAAHEMPLSAEDEVYFGVLFRGICDSRLVKGEDGWYHANPKFLPYPAKYISIRGVLEERYSVILVSNEDRLHTGTAILEEVEVSRAMFELYEGGVFMHQGEPYIVTEISHDSKIAKVIHSQVNYITSPRDFTNVDAIRTHRIRQIIDSPFRAYYGRVDVFVKVFGKFVITTNILVRNTGARNNSILDAVDVDTPSWEQETTGLWIDVPKPTLDFLRLAECKAAEKEYRTTESQRKRPARLIFYDAIGKGGGVTPKAFDHVSNILSKAYEAVESCPCEDGCTKCVQSTLCKEANQVSSKVGALIVLQSILGMEVHLDPARVTDGTTPSELETIVPADLVPEVEGITVETVEAGV